jgi:hypothetical protein
MMNRWGQARILQDAAARLASPLPARLGAWRLVSTPELESDTARVLQCAACQQAIYTNDETGDTLAVSLIVGPSGPTSAHTPEICYAGQEYHLVGDHHPVMVRDANGKSHSFWRLHASSQQGKRPDLQVLYGWSAGKAWEAASGPRFAFAGLPVLYKLQMVGAAHDRSPEHTFDPFQDLLSKLLAQIQPQLVPSSRLSVLAN